MSIDTIRTRPEHTTADVETDENSPRSALRTRRQYVDVSEVSVATVAEYARDAVGTDHVHLERRPGRTYLVVD